MGERCKRCGLDPDEVRIKQLYEFTFYSKGSHGKEKHSFYSAQEASFWAESYANERQANEGQFIYIGKHVVEVFTIRFNGDPKHVRRKTFRDADAATTWAKEHALKNGMQSWEVTCP